MTAIKLENVTKSFKSGDEEAVAVDSLDLEVQEGKLTALLGASGSGKSTTLKMLAGIEEPTAGRITIGGDPVYDSSNSLNVPPNKRSIGMVFQSYALWPHMTVFDNVAYPRRRRKLKKGLRERVMQILESVGCDHLAHRYPYQLSGGQQQRIALARALSADPNIVLFDEPLSNLDAKLRDRLKYELKEIQSQLKFSAIYVTHDQEEALTLGHECAVMRDGKISQLGSPTEIYNAPNDAFVFNFIGDTKFINGIVVDSSSDWTSIEVCGSNLKGRTRGRFEVGERVQLGVRSESITLAHQPSSTFDGTNTNSMVANVEASYFAGDTTAARIVIPDGTTIMLRVPHGVVHSEHHSLRFHAEDALVFKAED